MAVTSIWQSLAQEIEGELDGPGVLWLGTRVCTLVTVTVDIIVETVVLGGSCVVMVCVSPGAVITLVIVSPGSVVVKVSVVPGEETVVVTTCPGSETVRVSVVPGAVVVVVTVCPGSVIVDRIVLILVETTVVVMNCVGPGTVTGLVTTLVGPGVSMVTGTVTGMVTGMLIVVGETVVMVVVTGVPDTVITPKCEVSIALGQKWYPVLQWRLTAMQNCKTPGGEVLI